MYHHHRSRQCPILLQCRVLHHQAPRWRVHSLRQSDPSLQYRAVHCRIGRWQERSRSPILTHRHRPYPTITHANLLTRVPSHHGITSFKWCIPSGCTDRLPPYSLAESNDIPPEPVRRIQRKPTMTRPPSVPSLPRTMTDGVRLSSGFEFLRVLMLSGRAGFLPHDTTSDDQWSHPIPSDRTHGGPSQFWFLVQWLCRELWSCLTASSVSTSDAFPAAFRIP